MRNYLEILGARDSLKPKLSSRPCGQGAGYALEVKNPSPYYYNLINAGLAASVEGGKDIMNSEGGMVEPGGTQRYPLKDLKSMPVAGQKVKFEFLNDYGAGVVGEGVLSK